MTRPLFDPNSDPFANIQQAIEQARRERKNVLLDLGGDWCIWCHRLEAFIHSHDELRELRDKHYVTLKVYVGNDDERNVEFLSRLPPFEGVPHLLVYNSRGQLLCSQATDPFEEGESYNFELIKAFLQRWAGWRLSPHDSLSTDELRRRFERALTASSDEGPTLSA